MWIAMNDSFVSIVSGRNDNSNVVVRARVREDLVSLFPKFEDMVIETTDTDYRFRLFLDRDYASAVIARRVREISYGNFKDSVKQGWRKSAYTKIWQIMFQVQTNIYGWSQEKWWLNYRNNG